MTFPTSRRALLLGLPALLLAAGTAGAAWMMRVPSDLDLSREKATEAGLYMAAVAPVEEPVTVGPMHAWTVTLTDRDGAPLDGARITVDGGMPQHGHGLPTSPAVTQDLGGGRYLIEGMKFNMPGWWELDLSIEGPAGTDSVTFDLVL
ncbi:auxin-binding protein [Rubellimicrobium mesophilum DSM 19309]|uniref:Auxin-binding protein n=1 Tax=Rubellimicrobium mesophilum DSM 19309 TaxID=442562 RepID=A0A017HIV8_9RHOB|nr:FixH family protein [Rubellimicrobium mesophilum]EYD74270.1 auxin-binding protein [Rubellimicrobium mesophilum DSM 19309]